MLLRTRRWLGFITINCQSCLIDGSGRIGHVNRFSLTRVRRELALTIDNSASLERSQTISFFNLLQNLDGGRHTARFTAVASEGSSMAELILPRGREL